MQLVELQQTLEQFRSRGVGVVAISYDSIAILADFARRQGITFPMLSDPDSKIIKTFDILRPEPKGDMHYGIPNAGTYRVNPDGVVQSKYFLDDYHERYSAPTILLREFGSVAGTRETVVNTDHMALKYYSTRDVLRPDLHFTLVADFDLKPKMHVYAPGVEHYLPISFELDRSNYYYTAPAEYPKPETLLLAAIKESVPVFQGKFRISQDVTLRDRDHLGTIAGLKIKGRLRYQACDDKICYLPQTIPLEWTLKVEMIYTVHDRAPIDVQHGGPHVNVASGVVTGLEVGQKIPAFSARDQHGKAQTFDSIRGPNGAVIVFVRSADWSPYCKTQLEEMQEYWQEFGKHGVGFAVISYDSVNILADFARRKGITFPMLSDPDSKIIKGFGIFNPDIPKSDAVHYGMANPGTYRVDADGIVRSKYFEQEYQERYATPAILVREFGSFVGESEHSVTTDHLDLTYHSVDAVRPSQHITLVMDVSLKPDIRVAAQSAEKYLPMSFEVEPSYYFMAEPAQFPAPQNVTLAGTNEALPGYEGTVRITQEFEIENRDTLSELPPINIKGRLRFQPCDEKDCFPPQTIPVEVTLKVIRPDFERVPEKIQHGYSSELNAGQR